MLSAFVTIIWKKFILHSRIESAAKYVNIFSPVQWNTVASTAKNGGENTRQLKWKDEWKTLEVLQVDLKGSQHGQVDRHQMLESGIG